MCIVPIVGVSEEIEFPSLFLYPLRVLSVIDTLMKCLLFDAWMFCRRIPLTSVSRLENDVSSRY